MPIEFIGMIGVRPEGADGAAVHVIGGEIDPRWVRDFSRAHEEAGFDKVLVGYTATAAEGFVVATHAAAHTERLGFLIAHRPGFSLDVDGLPQALARQVSTRWARRVGDLRLGPSGLVWRQPITPLEISATAIRAAISEGRSPRYLLPDSVLDYIHRNQLYKDVDAG